MGFVASRRNQQRRSLSTGLPPRHLPLSGFLTLSAVSSHRRLVALFRATSVHRLSAFRAFSAQSAATPLGAPCSHAVSREAPRRTNPPVCSFAAASEPCSDRAADTPRDVINTSPGRCSPGLSPLRGLPIPVTGPKSAPLALHTVRRTNTPCLVAPQGMPSGSGVDSESRLSLHEVFHLVPSPSRPAPPASRPRKADTVASPSQLPARTSPGRLH